MNKYFLYIESRMPAKNSPCFQVQKDGTYNSCTVDFFTCSFTCTCISSQISFMYTGVSIMLVISGH